MSRHHPLLSVAAALLGCSVLLGGCVRQPRASTADGPPEDLGRPAEFSTTTTTLDGSAPNPSAGAVTTTTAPRAGGQAAPTTTGRPRDGAAATTTAPPKPLGASITDGQGDNGLGAPKYADVVTISLDDT